MPEATIGLALSGGGSRAIAFHLGCLRALHDLGILGKVTVLSTVSGGSVLGALYALSEEPFPEFEQHVRAVLRRGLLWPTVRTAFFTTEGIKALFCWAFVGAIDIVLLAVSRFLRTPVAVRAIGEAGALARGSLEATPQAVRQSHHDIQARRR